MPLDDDTLAQLRETARALLPLGGLDQPPAEPDEAAALEALVDRLADSYPFHAARYAGQMLKPPHRVAWAAYATAMLLNPNNHALDGGPATSALEREAVAELAAMVGLDPFLGHLTASGTIANLEALWVARQLRPDLAIASGANAHYTHERMCGVLGVRHVEIAADDRGRMDPSALADALQSGEIGTVVVTLGTTALGAVDQLHELLPIAHAHGVRVHVDAAYGGFFAIVADGAAGGAPAAPFGVLGAADSIVIDPHKHGLQPYGCGCVLFSDPAVGALYKHDSPYTYFTSADLHLGEISLECSRAGASAAALWATLLALPLSEAGLGRRLRASIGAAQAWHALASSSAELRPLVAPELDIIALVPAEATASAISAASQRAFDRLALEGVHLALLTVETDRLCRLLPGIAADQPQTTILRSCLIKPEHLAEVPRLHAALIAALSPTEATTP